MHQPLRRDLVAVSEVVDWLTDHHVGRATVNSVAMQLEAIGGVVNKGNPVRRIPALDGGARNLWVMRPERADGALRPDDRG